MHRDRFYIGNIAEFTVGKTQARFEGWLTLRKRFVFKCDLSKVVSP